MIDKAERTLISAYDIADALKRPRPTEQQVAVIEAPLAPALVVAGAGSGKTETMANRVLWLVANGFVRPSEVLGLTFTRKAAGELAARIRERLADLAEAGLVPGDYDSFEAPAVSTYNSYANSLFRDNAVLVGRESDGAILGEAAAWQLARTVVTRSRDARLPDLGKGLEEVTKAVLGISRAIAENFVDVAELREFTVEFAQIVELPPGGRGTYADVEVHAAVVSTLDVVIDLAEEFQAAKFAKGLIEYSDQVSLALQILRARPEVAAAERDKFRVVLLDEYQDTSVMQTWLLAQLFASHAVMAVGDPNQAIYGWRGASASNLDDFARSFSAGGEASGVVKFALSTSWRNGHSILRAANQVVEPFVATSRVQVVTLSAGPVASDAPVDSAYLETVEDEARAAAQWLGKRMSVADSRGALPSAAMLFRTRKTQPVFLAALREAGIKYHVLGLSGLLSEPEIADLVCALSVVNDPGAGLELVRLLAGARWRIGVHDLQMLRQLATRLQGLDFALRPLEHEVKQQLRNSMAAGEGGSIVDALDFVATAQPGHSFLSEFTELGVARLRSAGLFFARLRSRATSDIRDFVIVVVQELQLDIEVFANEFRGLGAAPVDAFLNALTGYLAIDDSANLHGFLTWLREAAQREDLSTRPEDPEPGTVQILTIHASKGLEWDHVVVPRLVQDDLPTKSKDGAKAWVRFGQLPWEFRGDAAELPEFEWSEASTRKEVLDTLKAFGVAVRSHHIDEERRLAYVAITRARHGLLLTGSFWASQIKPRPPSIFFTELADAGIVAPLPAAAQDAENPLGGQLEQVVWPFDPLGTRRAAVEQAAAAVREAEPVPAGFLGPQLELLLRERAARLDPSDLVAMPTRIPASRFKDFVSEPAAAAAAVRRPMPEKPYRATQIGTLFHSWVEDRYGALSSSSDLDSLVHETDLHDFVGEADLDALKRRFESSPWGSRSPVDVEREIHLPFDGQIVICKIDAVYQNGDRFEVVDWKTGKAPRDAKDLEHKQLQLALYRLAYAQWKGISPDLIDAVFYFVASNQIVRPERIFSEAELLAAWRGPLEGAAGE